jgi:hypothetical protein
MKKPARDKIIEFLRDGQQKDLSSIANFAKITWITARAYCLEMLAGGRIAGEKTNRGWLFKRKES